MHRLRRFILIAGTLLSLLIAAAFVVSGWWYVEIPGPDQMGVWASDGSFMFVSDCLLGSNFTVRRYEADWSQWNDWHFEYVDEWRTGSRGNNIAMLDSYIVVLPMWAAFLAVAIPTLLVWRFGWKPVKPGHCRCGYNLTGNTSGVCPECGRAI